MSFMSRDENDFADDAQLSLKRYSISRQKVNLDLETLQNESEKLFFHFIRYAKENDGESRGFSETVQGFYYDVLNLNCDFRDRTIRSSLTKRFKKLMKKYVRDNSTEQAKLDGFIF